MGINTYTRSGKTGVRYDIKLPHVVIKGSIMSWRYPTKNSEFGLPVCATTTRSFWTELVNVGLADCPEIVINTEKMKTRYMVGEENAETITLNPSPTSKKKKNATIKKKVPDLLFKTPDTDLDTEFRQLFDCLTERTEEPPTRCLGPLFRAARIKPFLDPLSAASLVDKCLDMLEVWEKEATFSYDFFRAMLLHFTDPNDLNLDEMCLEQIDVDSTMVMMGLSLSSTERKEARYNLPIAKTSLSLSQAMKVYEYVRAQRLVKMLKTSKSDMQRLAKAQIRGLVQKHKDETIDSFYYY